jgi:hypothetical protein
VVIFQGDEKVLLGDMIRILQIAKLAGAQQIAIAAKRVAPGQSQRLQTGPGTTSGWRAPNAGTRG